MSCIYIILLISAIYFAYIVCYIANIAYINREVVALSTQQFTARQYMVSPDFEFFHYKDDNNLEVEYHYHDFYEIYFFISGRVAYIVEGKFYSLKPGDILLINNKELHKPIIDEGTYERFVIWINPDFIRSACTSETDLFKCFESTSKKRYNLLRPDAKTLNIIKATINKLNVAYTGKGYGSDVLTRLYVLELLILLNRVYLESDVAAMKGDIVYNSRIDEIIYYVNANLDKDLSLDALSARYYISKYHLLREFKRHTGYTLYGYIRQKRLIAAKALLKDGMSITDVCQACGFNDYSNFIRAFSKTFNISPKKYSQQYSNEIKA